MYPDSVHRARNQRWSRIGRVVAALLMAAVLGGMGVFASGPAAAQSDSAWAYVYNHDYTADSYTPTDGYQYNSTGGANSILRTDVGVYEVTIADIQKEAQTQVTTISENGELCRIGNVASAGASAVYTVNCIAIGGEPVDIGFFLLTYRGTAGAASAYLWANDPAAETYTPDERYQYNSTGAVNTITRTDAGTYTVTLPGQGSESGTFQLSAANSGPGVACALRRWEIDAENNKLAEVNCFDSAGTRVDSGFTLYYADANDANQSTATSGAYTAAQHASEKNVYTPGVVYQFNSAGGENTVQWREIGAYTVTLPAVGKEAGNLQVTAVEYDVAACSIPRWVLNGESYEVDVICFDAEGKQQDSIFYLMYIVAE